jgi:hypothetical protein
MSLRYMSHVWETSPYQGTRFILHLAFASESNDEGYCRPSHFRICERLKRSNSQVWRLIQAMVRDRTIQILEVGTGQETTQYLLPPLPDVYWLDGEGSRPRDPRDRAHATPGIAPTRPKEEEEEDKSLINTSSSSSDLRDRAHATPGIAPTRPLEFAEGAIIRRLLESIGTPNRLVSDIRLLRPDLALVDLLSEIARCYDTKSKVKLPGMIAPMNIKAGDNPGSVYRNPEAWRKHIPDVVLQFAGLCSRCFTPVCQCEPDPVPEEETLTPSTEEIPGPFDQVWKQLKILMLNDCYSSGPEWVRRIRRLEQMAIYSIDRENGSAKVTIAVEDDQVGEWAIERFKETMERFLVGILDCQTEVIFDVL